MEARRSRVEYDEAKRGYEKARSQFFQLVDEWNVKEHIQVADYRSRLTKGGENMAQKTKKFIKDAIHKTLNEWNLGELQKEDPDIIGRGPDSAEARNSGGVTLLVVKSVAHAEEFLRLSQRELQTSLNMIKQDFVTAVRTLAEGARAKRFQELKDAIARLDPNMQPDLRVEILEDLDSQSVDIRQVAFNHIKNRVSNLRSCLSFLITTSSK